MEQTLFGATIVTERYNRGIFDLVNVMRPIIAEHAVDGESVGMRRNSGSDWELPGAFGFSQFMILSTNEAFIDALAALPTNADGYAFEKVTESLEGLVDLDQGTFQPEQMKAIGLFGDEGATEYLALRDRIAADEAANAELTEAIENSVSPVSAPLDVSFNGAQLSGAELTVIDESGNEVDPEDEEFDAFDEDEDDDWYDDDDDDLWDDEDEDDDWFDDEDEEDYEDD